MAKAISKSTTSKRHGGVKRATTQQEPTATTQQEPTAGADQEIWRHPAEKALVEIAKEDGGDHIEVMASSNGEINVVMPGSYRVEVRERGICVVPLASPRWAGDTLDRAWLTTEGAHVLGRILMAIAEAELAADEAMPAADQALAA